MFTIAIILSVLCVISVFIGFAGTDNDEVLFAVLLFQALAAGVAALVFLLIGLQQSENHNRINFEHACSAKGGNSYISASPDSADYVCVPGQPISIP